MFLVVLVVTFMFAKMITKPSEFERFGEHEVETEHDHDEDEFADRDDHIDLMAHNERKDIFVIEDVEGCIVNDMEQTPRSKVDNCHQILENRTRKLGLLSHLWQSLVSGALKENLFGSKFIELQP